jgi:hypothetical protein
VGEGVLTVIQLRTPDEVLMGWNSSFVLKMDELHGVLETADARQLLLWVETLDCLGHEWTDEFAESVFEREAMGESFLPACRLAAVETLNLVLKARSQWEVTLTPWEKRCLSSGHSIQIGRTILDPNGQTQRAT